ncbi:MAG TPA: hypothetical protein VEI07_20415 [Planctomycetaceae bacterium]|nr:hypothetical protein [Planctomycetaceae bacterium]
MSDEHAEEEVEKLASRLGPWLLVAMLLLGLGAGTLAWALTPPNSALRAAGSER